MKKLRSLVPGYPFIRNLESGTLMENFLIAAITSLLGMRAVLALTDYPQLGGEQYHIAHTLFGGLFMLIALIILITFLNREAKELASVLGGLGFGLFIDELGKFITQDNDYFFEPTAAFIYVVFVLIFLITRAIDRFIAISAQDYAVNALEIFKDVVIDDLDIQEKQRAALFLENSDGRDPVVKSMRKILQHVSSHRLTKPNPFSLTKKLLRDLYQDLLQLPWFMHMVVFFFVATTTLSFVQALAQFRTVDSFFDTTHILSSVLAGSFVLIGVVFMRRGHRLAAYEFYKYATLVSIFLTQFFLFYKQQFSALFALVLYITVYITLRYLISQELLLATNTSTLWERLRHALRKS
jgi:hypothetical protein